jgi:hypothetical protein
MALEILIVDFLRGKLMDFLYEGIKKGLLREFAPAMQSMESRLDRIEQKIDRLLTAPLRAGFAFLRMNDFAEAYRQFVLAESVEPNNANAKFWLGIALAGRGERELSALKLAEAFLINPYVAPADFLTTIAFPKSSERVALGTEPAWSHALDERLLPGYIGQRKIVTEFDSGVVRSATPVYVVSASVAGDWAAFSWDAGTATGQTKLTTIDLRSGKCIWTLTSGSPFEPGRQLVFASAKFVVVALTLDTKPRTICFELLDSATGSLTARMLEDQFRMTMCPDWDNLFTAPTFRGSNVTMVNSSTAYVRSTVRSNSKGLKALLGKLVPINHETAEFQDTNVLRDPFGLTPYRLQIKNVWSHVHARGEYPYYRPECFLNCHAFLECTS